ncbi:hypothetical protein D3C71_1465190 [compost metagenome]
MPASHHSSAFGARVGNDVFDRVKPFHVDKRPHGGAFIEPITHIQLAGSPSKAFHKGLIAVFMNIKTIAGYTHLTTVGKFRGN